MAFAGGRRIIDYDQANVDPGTFGRATLRRLIEEKPDEIYKVEVYEHVTKDGMLCFKKVFEMTKIQFIEEARRGI